MAKRSMFEPIAIDVIGQYLEDATIDLDSEKNEISIEVGPIRVLLSEDDRIRATMVEGPLTTIGDYEDLKAAAVALRDKLIEYRQVFDHAAYGATETERVAAITPGLVAYESEGVWEWVWCPDAAEAENAPVARSTDQADHGYRSAVEAVAAFAEYQTRKLEKAALILTHARQSIDKGLAAAVNEVGAL